MPTADPIQTDKVWIRDCDDAAKDKIVLLGPIEFFDDSTAVPGKVCIPLPRCHAMAFTFPGAINLIHGWPRILYGWKAKGPVRKKQLNKANKRIGAVIYYGED